MYNVCKQTSVVASQTRDRGEVVFVCKSGEKNAFIWLPAEEGSVKRLADADWEYIAKWYGLYEDVLYYATEDRLIGWNIATGEKDILFGLKDMGISGDNVPETAMVETADGVQLLVAQNRNRFILTLSEEESVKVGELVLANICGENSFLKERVISFSKENPLYGINYEEAYKTEEEPAACQGRNQRQNGYPGKSGCL